MIVCAWCLGEKALFDHDKCARAIDFVRGTRWDPDLRAPPRESLRVFGGPLTLDQFHEHTARDVQCHYAPMTVMVKKKEDKRCVRVPGKKLKSINEL